jgi:hypothetical protein
MRRGLLLSILALVALTASPMEAYLKLGTTQGGKTVTLKWTDFPIQYFITNSAGGGVSADGLRDAVGRGFATWEAVDTADITSSFGGFTNARPNDDDGLTVIGFVNRPDQDRTLGATSFLVDVQTGEIVESEIYFNSFFNWSVAANGEAGRFDLESIAVHEIGHLLGAPSVARCGRMIGRACQTSIRTPPTAANAAASAGASSRTAQEFWARTWSLSIRGRGAWSAASR